jgi:hypothetical protein
MTTKKQGQGMRVFKRILVMLILLCFIGAGAWYWGVRVPDDLAQPAFPNTAQAGIELLAKGLCAPGDSKPECAAETVAITSNDGAQVVNVAAFTDCSGTTEFPSIPVKATKQKTLVIRGRRAPFFKRDLTSAPSDDCLKSITFKLTKRLEPGDTLYVTYDGRVIGSAPIEAK